MVIVNIHPTVKEIAGIFNAAGKQLHLVGGAVRDLLRGRSVKDWDLATDALPDEVISLFQRGRQKTRGAECGVKSFVIPTGIKHGTVTLHYRDLSVEITTFRSESGYSDGRRPDRVEFGVSIEADLSRRDFTMNAAAWKLPAGPLADPFDGQGDIRRRLIRCVGNPEERFAEDGLRPMRALRFASQLGFEVDPALLAAVPGALPLTAKVSPERIMDELNKILSTDKPSTALLLMEQTGLLRLLIPELASCREVEQKGWHKFDVLDHSLLACDFAARGGCSRELRLAALYHDLGKVKTARVGENGVWTFYGHERESAALARNILLRLRYPNAVIDRVCHLIEEHMFHYEEIWSDAAVRRFVIRAGEENLDDLFALRRADTFGMTALEPPANLLLPFVERIDSVLAKGRALSLRNLAVSGNDLIALGIPAGKHVGVILRELFEAALDDPALNTREKMLEIAGNLKRRYE